MNTSTKTEVRPRRAIVAIALLVALLASVAVLPGIADAQEVDPPTVEGRGWLYAKGSGDVDVDMAGRIRLHVDGDVSIVDNAGDMRVRLRGATDSADEERTTNVSLTAFRGFVSVRGSDFSVIVDGQVVLNAHGRGQASLTGKGMYKTRNGEWTAWDGAVAIGDGQLEPVQ